MGASTLALVKELKESDQDHEFYPTTDQIIHETIADFKRESASKWCPHNKGRFWGGRDRESKGATIMDIGAGAGKVLKAFKNDKDLDVETLYAIEKSAILRNKLPHDVFVIGTDFHCQTLIDKGCDVIFCNPPYSEFSTWFVKIVRESMAPLNYLVIPSRWVDNEDITAALKDRNMQARIVGSFDFQDAEDRKARAKVDLVCLTTEKKGNRADPFEAFFNEHFAEARAKAQAARKKKEEEMAGKARVKTGNPKDLVVGVNYPDMLVFLYNQQRQDIQDRYTRLAEMDFSDLGDLGVTVGTIIVTLKQKLFGLKDLYWKELFSKLDTISKRLTSKNRDLVMKKLVGNVGVDFTLDNITAVLQWVIANSNHYMDVQLVEVFEAMAESCNTKNYKSNHKVWVEDRHRYSFKDSDGNYQHEKFKLEYRIVTSGKGGIHPRDSILSYQQGLKESACLFLQDIMTVACNLGYTCNPTDRRFDDPYRQPSDCPGPIPMYRYDWKSGECYEFRCTDRKGRDVVLFDVRAFYVGTVHIRFNQDFMRTLNVEYGRLRGWLKSPKDAAEELGDPKAAAEFNTTLYLGDTSTLLLQ